MSYNMTDYVAWWGAILATGVLIWDIYKHRSSKAVILVRTSTIVYPDKSLEIEVSNIGSKSTTITRVYAQEIEGIVVNEETGERVRIPSGGTRYQAGAEERFSLPYNLPPGSVWVGKIDPSHFEWIDSLDKIMLKVRDERGEKVARRVVSIPSVWRRPRVQERDSDQSSA